MTNDGDKKKNNEQVLPTDDVHNNFRKKRSVLVVGDSMVQRLDKHKMRRGVYNQQRVFIKSFPGATTKDMLSYVEPSKQHKNDMIILHCGTNDLRSSKPAEIIAKEIRDLAHDLKTQENEVMVSGLVPRGDRLNAKANEVNKVLTSLCADDNLYFIDNWNIDARKHLDFKGLHLNDEGLNMFGGNLVDAILL